MAHWSSGYADFHDELYAEPPTPVAPPLLHCADCDATFTQLSDLRQHAFEAHPVAHPALTLRGQACGDARLLVQRVTTPTDWLPTNATWARVNDTEVVPDDLGEYLSVARGVVDVRLGNNRTERGFSFDLAVASDTDLRGVDNALRQLIEDDDLDIHSISTFVDSARGYPTAGNYTDGISEYLYWLASRRSGGVDAATSVRHHEKLNRAANLLGDVPRPAARAITSLASLYFNHFDEAADRALSSHLHDLSMRLSRMLTARTSSEDHAVIDGELSHLERLLMDRHTAGLLTLCGLPLTPASTTTVVEFNCPTTDPYDRLKQHLFTAEHHLATGDPRAAQLVRTGSQIHIPDHWVNTRLDQLTHEGTTCPTAPATPAQEEAPTRGKGSRTASRTEATAPPKTESTTRAHRLSQATAGTLTGGTTSRAEDRTNRKKASPSRAENRATTPPGSSPAVTKGTSVAQTHVTATTRESAGPTRMGAVSATEADRTKPLDVARRATVTKAPTSPARGPVPPTKASPPEAKLTATPATADRPPWSTTPIHPSSLTSPERGPDDDGGAPRTKLLLSRLIPRRK